MVATADDIPAVELDPVNPITVSGKQVHIPEPTYKLNQLLDARRLEFEEGEYDVDDTDIFNGKDTRYTTLMPSAAMEEEPTPAPIAPQDSGGWVHDAEWVKECMPHVMPPPSDASPMATVTLSKELKGMLREQESARSIEELGWYMPPEFIGDNLFQWIVELHSFDPDLPIAKDMAAQ